jgi:hypothetical protein
MRNEIIFLIHAISSRRPCICKKQIYYSKLLIIKMKSEFTSRYKMCSKQNVNTLGGSRNKLPSKNTELSVTKPNYAEIDF